MDLDKIKEAWKGQANKEKYTSEQIFKMLKSKSINSVKWIFIISLSEIFIAIFIYIFSLIKSNINIINTLQTRDLSVSWIYTALNIIVLVVSIVFVYYFYKYYMKIQVQSSVMDLTKQIINFRKKVNYFIYFNMGMFFIIFSILIFLISKSYYNIDWLSIKGIWVILAIIFVFVFSSALFYLYYYLIYGTFLRRLKSNLNHLKSVD